MRGVENMDIRKELFDLCEKTSKVLPGIDYESAFKTPSTVPKDSRVAILGELLVLKQSIKDLCTPIELAFFEFFFEKRDLGGKPSCLLKLGKYLYENKRNDEDINVYIGTLVANRWRKLENGHDGDRIVELICKAMSCKPKAAQKIFDRKKVKLSELLTDFTNTNNLLADEIGRKLEKHIIQLKMLK